MHITKTRLNETDGICVEMLIAAACHFYAFPYKEYAGANVGGSGSFSGSLSHDSHAVKLNDFYHDTVHQVTTTSMFQIIALSSWLPDD